MKTLSMTDGSQDPVYPGRGEGWGRLGIAEAQLVGPLTEEGWWREAVSDH